MPSTTGQRRTSVQRRRECEIGSGGLTGGVAAGTSSVFGLAGVAPDGPLHPFADDAGRITRIYAMRNPHKLGRIAEETALSR